MRNIKTLLLLTTCFGLGILFGARWQSSSYQSLPSFSQASAAEVDQKPSGETERETPQTNSTSPAFATAALVAQNDTTTQSKKPLRIICFGAHPDDCEIKAGGVAALWAAAGHRVKFVSVTNGDIGHWREAGGPLAQRRNAEVQKAAELLGITTEVLDIHDGELMPTLENRKKLVRLIREWNADVVMGPRTNDYHPDHRYTGVLMQDAAFMVAVPYFCPDVKPLSKNPVFLYYQDRFKKPYPFEADIAVATDAVVKQKIDALVGMESQFVEGGALGSQDLVDGGEAKLKERRQKVRQAFSSRDRKTAETYREQLTKWYGAPAAKQVAYAEVFEVCEYGRQPTDDELKEIFPFAIRR